VCCTAGATRRSPPLWLARTALRARVRAKVARQRNRERKGCERDDSGGGASPSFPLDMRLDEA